MARGSRKAQHAKRRRTKSAVELTDEELAARLMTQDGLRLAMANLLQRVRRGGTRDQVSAMIAERHGYEWFGEQLAEQLEADRLADLEAQLAELRVAVAGKQGSATRASARTVEVPFTDEGTNQLRDDMAETPDPPRGGEPYQS